MFQTYKQQEATTSVQVYPFPFWYQTGNHVNNIARKSKKVLCIARKSKKDTMCVGQSLARKSTKGAVYKKY